MAKRRFLESGLLGLAIVAAATYATADASPDTPSVDATSAAVDDGVAVPAATPAPTWETLYARYMAAGTVGDCASCHAEAATPGGAYAWLAKQSYMRGTPYLIDPRASCFSWLGGDMPPKGPSRYVRAEEDFDAWGATQAAAN